MLRHIDTDEGNVTVFYPNVFTPKLVLHVTFITGINSYDLEHFGSGKLLLHFAIYDDGRRLDLTVPDKSGIDKASGGST